MSTDLRIKHLEQQVRLLRDNLDYCCSELPELRGSFDEDWRNLQEMQAQAMETQTRGDRNRK